jgi:site-specific recombinase XerD
MLLLKKYREFVAKEDIFFKSNPRLIEQKIIEFILHLKQQGKSYAAIRIYLAAVKSFYKINDIFLNDSKISKFLPEQKRVRKDRAYNHKEISKLLEIAEERMRVVILLLASTGVRIGSLPELRLRNLERISDDCYKLTVYENYNQEYMTLCTPECSKAIDNYLDMRSAYGENITSESFLIREQFDIREQFAIRKPRKITHRSLEWKLINLAERSGIRKREHETKSKKFSSIRKDVAIAHGFRKFFTTQLINSKVNSEIREMLLGHKIGLASAYYRPTDEEIYQQYLKAVDLLTINEENRLKRKVHDLSNKTKENEYIITSKLAEKDNEINSLKNQGLNNADAIGALSDKLMKALEDIELLKQRH